ncbi:ADP-ribosylglycohydrolase family protein [Patescibacteria group bacterium]|nr:ADP-ribosylglycohydrolase family protein [Patescibacteria group bacterium]
MTQANPHLLGAIAGDMIGSIYEYTSQKTMDFPLFKPSSHFTDDSVLTLAVADAILNQCSYLEYIRSYANSYPHSGYGLSFVKWLFSDSLLPYNSYGNGSAMRVSAVGWAFESVEKVLQEAEASAVVTHNHPEGIKGAQAVALAIYFSRNGTGKDKIRREISTRFAYDLSPTLDQVRPTYRFNETCQETVPQALIAFLESLDFEDALRNAVSLGGDADTLAAITGSIAEAFYGSVPQEIASQVKQRLPAELWNVVERFNQHLVKL